jgi:uncharacterized membrane protein
MNIWEAIKNYYLTLGEKYSVDPVIFLGIHIVATPPFLAGVWWIVRNKKRNQSIIIPVLVTLFFFNAANLYLIFYGRNIPWWIYTFIGAMTLYSGYATYKKIKKKIAA